MDNEFISYIVKAYGLSYSEAVGVATMMEDFKNPATEAKIRAIPLRYYGLLQRAKFFYLMEDTIYSEDQLVMYAAFSYVREDWNRLDLIRYWNEIHDDLCDCGRNLTESFEAAQASYRAEMEDIHNLAHDITEMLLSRLGDDDVEDDDEYHDDDDNYRDQWKWN